MHHLLSQAVFHSKLLEHQSVASTSLNKNFVSKYEAAVQLRKNEMLLGGWLLGFQPTPTESTSQLCMGQNCILKLDGFRRWPVAGKI
jgi:hypothetical protein